MAERHPRERKKQKRVWEWVYCDRKRGIHHVKDVLPLGSICPGNHRPVYVMAFKREGEF